VRGGAALITLAVTTIGLPIALFRLGGSPIPSHVPPWHAVTFALLHRDNGSLFLGAVRDISWLAWAAFTMAVLAEAQAVLRGRPAPRLHLLGLQGAAAKLVAVASVSFTTPTAVSLAATPALAAPAAFEAHGEPAVTWAAAGQAARMRPAAGQLITLDALVKPGEVAMHDEAQTEAARQVHARRTVVVQPGDCLWTIAAHYLGAGDRYPALIRLNLGHEMTDGQVFTDPSLIMPGWELKLPASAGSGRHTGSPSGSGHHDGHPSGNKHFRDPHPGAGVGGGSAGAGGAGAGSGSAGVAGGQGNGAGSGSGRSAGGAGQGAGSGQGAGGGQGASSGQGTSGAQGAGAGQGGRPSSGQASWQQEEVQQAVLFTLGMLAGGALVCLERLRHRQRQHRRLGRRIALPADEDSRRIEQKLRAAASPAPPASLRYALCDLSAGVADGGDPLPPIVGIHLTRDSIDVLLSAPAAGPPPPPFSIAPGRQAMCWTTTLTGVPQDWATAPPMPGEVGDLLPGLFTAGVTDGGFLLLDLEAMRVTCCDGPAELTDRLLVTAATELAASRWSGWYELILAGCDELEVLGRADRCRDLDEAIDVLEARVATIERRLGDDRQADVRTRRMEDPEDEDWGLTLLVSRVQPTPAQMARLLDLSDGPGGIAALVAGDTQAADGKLAPAVFRLEADPNGPGGMIATITLSYLGPNHQLTVRPQTLTVAEYDALAGLFATAAGTADVSPEAAPYDEVGGPPWMQFAAAPILPDLEEVPTDMDSAGESAAFAAGFARPVGMPEPGGPPQPGSPPGADDLAEPRELAGPAGWDRGQQPWRHQDQARPNPARHARPSLSVNVLGTFEVLGSAEPLQPKQAELVLALALHAPVGLPNSALCTMLGADADHPRPADSVRQLITRTRRRLGQADDGQEHIIHLGSGIYVLHNDVRLDWAAFSALARRGRAERSVPELRAALELVRGEPFAECYHWWIDIALVETMRAEIVDTADLLAQLELAAGDARSAARAARIGLSAETAAEQLWRALMRAEHAAGNAAGVADAWSACLDAITEIAPAGEPHPDTERLYRQLSRGEHALSLRT
jgi:DNA-binding SARP family transcriptional activator